MWVHLLPPFSERELEPFKPSEPLCIDVEVSVECTPPLLVLLLVVSLLVQALAVPQVETLKKEWEKPFR